MFSKLRGTEGFTFIEILMALTVIAVLFVPVMQLFSHSMGATSQTLDMITATNLAQSEMERTINLNLSEERLKALGSQLIPPPSKSALIVNGTAWRIEREIVEGSDPAEVRIHVFREGEPAKRLVTLVTLVEDMMWESVKSISST